MSTSPDHALTAGDGLALLCIEWLIQDHPVLPQVLSEKLACPTYQLYDLLVTLTDQENQALRRCISTAAASNSLAGPLHTHELFHFLDSIAGRTCTSPVAVAT